MNDREHIRDIKEEYKTPPVPTGFAHVKGEWDDGFVIRQIKDAFESESEFVWIPVCLLDANGTLDGQNFQEQFGARNYRYSGLPSRNVPEELALQAESVQKYGGFYISRFPVSIDDDGDPCAVEKRMPVTMVSHLQADHQARRYDGGPDVSAHLPYAAEMDSVIAWLLKSGEITLRDVREAVALRESKYPNRKPVYYTGIQEDEKKGLFDIFTNVDEWTQEQYDEPFLTGCGASCTFPKTARCYFRPYACYSFYGFRLALYIR